MGGYSVYLKAGLLLWRSRRCGDRRSWIRDEAAIGPDYGLPEHEKSAEQEAPRPPDVGRARLRALAPVLSGGPTLFSCALEALFGVTLFGASDALHRSCPRVPPAPIAEDPRYRGAGDTLVAIQLHAVVRLYVAFRLRIHSCSRVSIRRRAPFTLLIATLLSAARAGTSRANHA